MIFFHTGERRKKCIVIYAEKYAIDKLFILPKKMYIKKKTKSEGDRKRKIHDTCLMYTHSNKRCRK